MSKDWRSYAYLQKKRWPEAIPWTGPKRKYGPYPWGEITHENPHGVDTYPNSHPDAASVGTEYLGDVCPQCGKPIKWTEEVVTIRGGRGVFGEISEIDNPIPAYHPVCHVEREATIRSIENERLQDYV